TTIITTAALIAVFITLSSFKYEVHDASIYPARDAAKQGYAYSDMGESSGQTRRWLKHRNADSSTHHSCTMGMAAIHGRVPNRGEQKPPANAAVGKRSYWDLAHDPKNGIV